MNVKSCRLPGQLARLTITGLGALAIAAGLLSVDQAKAGNSAKASRETDGAKLYSMHCARCHAERYPTERTDAQWKTIMLHMRTRATIPAVDSEAILEYMQDSN
ncbi:MAG: hypothetical protein O2901_15010 [Verrucomicrobia bacterium]|nr:hypothetical protein [Verrucomicrobiota bacterium]